MLSTASTRSLSACLTASAVVLAGLLAAQLGGRSGLPAAEASIYNPQQAYTFHSAAVADDEEGLFVIDNATGVLLVYHLSADDERMILANGLRLDEIFTAGAEAGESDGLGGGDDRD